MKSHSSTLPLSTAALVLLGIGCTGLEAVEGDFTIDVQVDDAMVTLVEVNWTTDEPGYSWVEYGTTQAMELSTDVSSEATTDHSFLLYGVPALSDIYVTAYTEIDGEVLTSFAEISTPNVPSNLPDPTVTVFDEDRADSSLYIVGSILGENNLLFAINREGEWLWYTEPDDTLCTFDTQISRDGHGLVYNLFAMDNSLHHGYLNHIGIDGQVTDEFITVGAHHAFAQLPDGNTAVIVADVRDWQNPGTGEVETVVGDAIQEIDAEGNLQTIFSTWDWSDPWVHEDWDVEYYPGMKDWTHGNSLAYYEDRDTYLISLANIDTVLEVNRTTGDVVRSFGPRMEYDYLPGTPPADFQHDAQLTPQGTLIMTSRIEHDHTLGIEYSIDESTKTLEEVWSYGDDANLLAITQGQITILPNGNTLVNFGTAGVIREVTPEGDVVWELQADAGSWFGYVELFNDFYALQ